jgi:hypothetical protein
LLIARIGYFVSFLSLGALLLLAIPVCVVGVEVGGSADEKGS